MLKEFKDQVAVITGAGSGFGREFALIAARRGMKLVLADIQAEALNDTVNMVESLGAQTIAEKCDVSVGAQVDQLRDQCVSKFGAPHLLFNNAGVAHGGLIWEHSVDDWEWVIGVNLWGVIHGIRAFVPGMLAHGQPGHIINTASVAGLLSAPTMGMYNVSKHGVVAASETLYHDLKMVKSALSASVLCPAFVPTGIASSERNRPAAESGEHTTTASMEAARAASTKAVSSGRITAAQVAEQTYGAIESDSFYIVTHQRIMESVRLRTSDVAEQRNPTDPFSLKRDVAPK